MSAVSALAAPARRGPALAARIALAVAALALLWPAVEISEFEPHRLLDPDHLAVMGRFPDSFFPMALGADFLSLVATSALETLALATAGTALAMPLALPLAIAVSRSLSASALLRAPVHTAGVLGRLFAETLENAPREPAQALRHAGSGAGAAFLYGTLPVVLPQFVSYALYRWEHNIRMAAVLGFVGAGGPGQLLYVSLSLFKTGEAATVLLAMIGIVAAVDLLSGWLRRILAPA